MGFLDKAKQTAEKAKEMGEAAKERAEQAKVERKSADDARGVIFEGMSHEAGRNAKVTLYADRIERVKERSRVSLSGAKQDVEVTPIHAVSSVATEKDGIRFTKIKVFASGNPTIEFRFGHDESQRFRAAITDLILRKTDAPAPAAPAPATAPDIADQLRKLGDLRDAGILTPEEFDAKKADLLSRM